MFTGIKLPSVGLAMVLAAAQPVLAAQSVAIAPPKTDWTPVQIVRETLAVHFGERKLNGQTIDEFSKSLPVKQRFLKRAGVFVTLSYKGKSRACWGNVFPEYDTIRTAIVNTTLNALTKDYRFAPIRRSQIKTLKPQVTIIKSVDPIDSIRMQNPLRDGLLVRAGGRSGVLLPGEAADATYQLVQCKLKAGIRPGEPCQLYRLRTEIYE